MRRALRRLIPGSMLGDYHGMIARLGASLYGHPTEKMVVVGITGTSGKTTTGMLLHAILERANLPAALASSAVFAIRDRWTINDTKMTMLGRFRLQRFLKSAQQAGCRVAIVETTSEGLAQNRHLGIDYDIAVLTNLTPEHIESHGSFAAYQKAKEKLFHVLTLTRRKLNQPKTIVVNGDDPSASSFLRHAADRYVLFTTGRTEIEGVDVIAAKNVELTTSGSTFTLHYNGQRQSVQLHLLGRINVENALAAAAVAVSMNVPLETIAEGLAEIESVPGRLEFFRAGGVSVIVDYAFHPKAMESLYQIVEQLPHRKILHVLGGTGGGRDRSRRPVLGQIAGERADVVIVTNEDPYDEDPYSIMDDVLGGIMSLAGKSLDENVFRIYDRHHAIAKAVELSSRGDIILVTGKGSEQAIVVAGGKHVPWDDREVVKSVLSERFGQLEDERS